MRFVSAILAASLTLLVGASGAPRTADAKPADSDGQVIARVGDQAITFPEINVALNSSAIVGVSVPALGTPERDTARITLLDRFISANLLYLDARKQGMDRDPRYQEAITRFSNGMLAGLYRRQIMAGDIPVTEVEVQGWYEKHLKPDTELTDGLRLQIQTTLRQQRLHQRLAAAKERLREGVDVVVHPENLASKGDGTRPGDTPLAVVDKEVLTWGRIGDRIVAAGKGATMADPLAFEDQARRAALEHEIDLRIMVQKARAAGLDRDRVYRKRLAEYRKTLLVNMYRDKLVMDMEPSDRDLEAYYEANRTRLMIPEARKVQLVVVESRDQAQDIKRRLEAGEITMYQAARDYSIAPNAKTDLGELGWVNQGTAAPVLDKAIFSLGPGEISDPIESPAGWNLVTVQEVNESRFTDFTDATTRKTVRRRYLHERLDAYTTALREEQFPVEVYQDRLVRLAQQEADMVRSLAQQSEKPGSVTQERIEEMQKYITPSR